MPDKPRDPRVDPRPGDVLRKNNAAQPTVYRTVTVVSVGHGAVRYSSVPPMPYDSNYFHLSDWGFLMRNAEVIKHAGE